MNPRVVALIFGYMVDLRISDTFEYYREVWFGGDILGIA